jgi:hypothetical protein
VLWNYFITFDYTPEQIKSAAAAAGLSDGKLNDTLIAYFSSAKNLKSMLAFGTIVTAYLFLLRMLINLTLSSFHLSLDAREREQLTYVYLALVKKGQDENQELIAEKERAIVLQSIFSRADTGLLKGDSSPTIPGELSQLIKNLGGGR